MASSSSTGEEPPLVTTEAKMVVATGRGHCQQLKDMLSKEDTSTMVVVMASSNKTSTPPKPRSPAMDYRLLAAACSGSFQDLESLLNREASSDGAVGSSGDEEAFPRESLLDGLTVGGDTALHVVAGAANCDGEDNLKKAGLIHSKAANLLFVQNNNRDTPLHCAARAAKPQMLSLLINLARGEDVDTNRVKALLETENKIKETALHEAVRIGNNPMVKLLMKEDPQLASFPKDGTSPLYLAILMEKKTIAETLYEMSGGFPSYSGPNGENALHAAVLRGKGLTNMLLEWNNGLTIQRDEKGNTPLHFVASMKGRRDQRIIRSRLLQANLEALYQPDHEGSFPIHVAASVNATAAVSDFIKNSPNCGGLRDARGRTFLHAAVDKKQIWTVYRACRNRSLSWILNMQDNDGNTALHLAVQAESLIIVCYLLRNGQVHLNLTNWKGETPLDVAYFNRAKDSFGFSQNSEVKIHVALKIANAKYGIYREDYFEENCILYKRQYEKLKVEKVKDATQNLCIASALIATVTFGATFAMPGGYRADDHINGGTPTLAGRYDFDTFTLANALAFTSSAMATISLMFSGSPFLHPRSRMIHLNMAYYLMSISVKSMVTAFAIGTYMMLAPVAHKTAVAVCVLSSLVLLYQNLDMIIKNLFLVAPLCVRKGVVLTFLWLMSIIPISILVEGWPLIVIFCSTLRNYPAGKVEP